jgi:MFS superfamily sulfate permease-like transporter
MDFPLGIWDISLLFALAAIVLLITSELLSPYYGQINLKISRKRLRNSALTFAVLFLTTLAIRIVNIILNM